MRVSGGSPEVLGQQGVTTARPLLDIGIFGVPACFSLLGFLLYIYLPRWTVVCMPDFKLSAALEGHGDDVSWLPALRRHIQSTLIAMHHHHNNTHANAAARFAP